MRGLVGSSKYARVKESAFEVTLRSAALRNDTMLDSPIWLLLVAGYFLTWALLPQVLLKRTVHTSAAVAWILGIIFLPYIGALAFAIFGSMRFERRRVKKREASDAINRKVPRWSKRYAIDRELVGKWSSVARLASELCHSELLSGNRVEVITDTKETLDWIEEEIKKAKHWIHVEFYIWRHDEAGTRLRDLLVEKAREGVRVRFLCDGIGSMLLSRKFLRSMEEAGISVASFAAGLELLHPANLNLRNHRKIVIVDGQCGFTGGMNIGDEYIHRTKSWGKWRDTQLRIRGPAVLQLQQVFAQDWFYATGEELTGSEFFPEPPRQESDIVCQVVADGPDNDLDSYYSLMVAALGQAQERVRLATPYFVPPEGLAMALETAARRGVDVEIMIAGRANFPWTLQAGRSYYKALLSAGVRIYEYQKGLFHPKTMTVDGYWSLIGTFNCDFRSLYLNFEGAVATFDEALAGQLESEFLADRKHADQIDPDAWARRSRLTILQENFWRLVAPIL